MRPVSILHIKAHSDIWEVSQDFIRLGKYPVTVRAVGFSRQDAIKQFKRAVFWEDQPQEDAFKALWDSLWSLAGVLDSLIQFLGHIKAFINLKLYNN